MSNRIKTIGSLVALASISSVMAVTVPSQRASAQNTYSTEFVARYKTRCQTELLSTKRYTPDKASSVCACSLNNMQRVKTQSAAISFLVTQEAASLFESKDARTGLPKKLTNDYFVSCLG